jgi:hypothetical protein
MNEPGSSTPRSSYTVPGKLPLGLKSRTTSRNRLQGLEWLNQTDLRQLSPEMLNAPRMDAEEVGVRLLNPQLEGSSLFQQMGRFDLRGKSEQEVGEFKGKETAKGRRSADLKDSDRSGRGRRSATSLESPLEGYLEPPKGKALDRRLDNRIDRRLDVEPIRPVRESREPLRAQQGFAEVGEQTAGLEPIRRPTQSRRSLEQRMAGDVFRGMTMTASSLSRPMRKEDMEDQEGMANLPPLDRALSQLPSQQVDQSPPPERPPTVKETFSEIEAAAREREGVSEEDVSGKEDVFRKYLEAPVKTFVGADRSRVNKFLARGEKSLKAGEYYRARQAFDIALTLDPEHALAMLGKAHASLGAGEYLSSARQLVNAIELFPEIAWFKLDLRALMQRADELDRRRVDLEEILASNENANLRFLLGYIEYYSGLKKYGLANFEKAAEASEPGSPIARFVEMLKAADAMPAPTTKPAASQP